MANQEAPHETAEPDESVKSLDQTEDQSVSQPSSDASVATMPDSPNTGDEPEADAPTPSSTQHQKPKFSLSRFKIRSKKQAILLIVVFVIILGALGGGGFYWKYHSSHRQTSNNQTPTQNTSIPTATAAQPAPLKLDDPVIIDGNTYLSSPKRLGDLKFYKNPENYFGQSCEADQKNCKPVVTSGDIRYYQIGQTKTGQAIIVYVVPAHDIGGDTTEIVIESSPTNYQVLFRMEPYFSEQTPNETLAARFEDMKQAYNSNVTVNTGLLLSELQFPKEIEVGGQKLAASTLNGYFLEDGLKSIRGSYYQQDKPQSPVKIADKDGRSYYRLISSEEDNYLISEVYGTFGNLFAVSYKLNGELTSQNDKPLTITWSQGDQNQSAYYSRGQGCGSAYGYVIGKNVASSLIKIGRSSGGQDIYQLPTSHALVQELFDKDYIKGENLDNNDLKNLSLQQFSDKHAYFLVENGFKEWVLLLRSDMFFQGGCAKPVIYLYPEKPINVSVRVGAKVVISNPLYPKNGWQNVLARPDGQLSYHGQYYDSLFWEGYGNGRYPDISSGKVVSRADAPATIRSQLAEQGLNQKEIADFMTYWEAKLPNTNYVRLTWLNTGQLNQLAPLTITPVPRTVIRVFLDFEGLDQFIDLPPQSFKAPLRQGFSVVEWGGLARNGLPTAP